MKSLVGTNGFGIERRLAAIDIRKRIRRPCECYLANERLSLRAAVQNDRRVLGIEDSVRATDNSFLQRLIREADPRGEIVPVCRDNTVLDSRVTQEHQAARRFRKSRGLLARKKAISLLSGSPNADLGSQRSPKFSVNLGVTRKSS